MGKTMNIIEAADNVKEILGERSRKRAEIQDKINNWNAELAKAQEKISELNNEKTNLDDYITDWNTKKGTYSENEIISDVVVLNVFEGVCADKIKDDLTAAIAQMDQTCSKVSVLGDNIQLQIDRLYVYIECINTMISFLTNELNSI